MTPTLTITPGMSGYRLALQGEQRFVVLSEHSTASGAMEAFRATKAALTAYATALDLIDSVAPSITKAA